MVPGSHCLEGVGFYFKKIIIISKVASKTDKQNKLLGLFHRFSLSNHPKNKMGAKIVDFLES